MFATVCVIAVLTFLAECFSRERRIWPGIWLIIGLWSLWVSDSRTGQIVLVVVISSIVFVKWARRDRSMTVATIGIFGILAAGLAAALVGVSTATISLAMGRGQNFTGRTEIWSETLKEITNSPWIGTGFLTAWRDDSATAIRIRGALGFRAAHAHNGYLDVWLQLGIIGLLLILGLALVAASRALRLCWSDENVYYLWALAICVANLSYNLTETRFTLAIAWVLAVVVYAKLSDDVRNSTRHGEVAEQGKCGVPSLRTNERSAEPVIHPLARRGFAGQR
ncbi:O-antigen ligase family protein [Rhodococcus sp. NPDC047139]|uniref:O-antigen ligase family protein n=1 Tax=Rhodococcus sp. NPDC047139 TaxID=3155141 RepID=UPI0033DA0713